MLAEVVYSTGNYEKARKYNVKMAYRKGKVDKVFEYCEDDLSEEFKEKNKRILSCKRGAGYWVWKPYAVDKALTELEEGDYLFYCDGGAFVTKDLHILVEFMKREETDILFFNLSATEKQWTKRDVFLALSCDDGAYTDTPQRCATYFLIKKTDRSEQFVKEWLQYAQIYELISDEDNVLYGQDNYDGFCDNRHDQSILSVLSKRYGYPAYADISQFRYPRGMLTRMKAKREQKERIPYPIMICLHRQKKADISTRLRECILNYIPQLRRVLHYGYH